jgi:phage tail sheath gpL-like
VISPQKVLLVAPKTAAGTAVSGALNETVSNATNDIDALAGARSLGAQAMREFKKINQLSQLDVILLDDDGAGVAATGTVVFGGAATEDGTLTIEIGSTTNHTITYNITDLDTPTLAGDALVAAITADTRVPVTAANVTGTVTLTAANDGTEGNDISLKISGSVAGLTVTLTGMASGATNPTLTGVFDVVGDNRYQTVIWPHSWGTTDIAAFLDPRFNAGELIQDGVAIMTSTDTYANHISAITAENSQSLQIRALNSINDTDYKGSTILELGLNISAQASAIRALRLTQDAPISQYVIASGLDVFGGPHLASLPYHNTPYSSLPLIPTGKGFDGTELAGIEAAGGTNMGNNKAGNSIIDGTVLTTYKTDSAGNPDVSFTKQNYVDTSSNIREYFQNNSAARFAQSRLTEGDIVANHNMVNEGAIRAFMKGLYRTLSGQGFVLVQAGGDAETFFNDNLSITLDLSLGKVTMTMKVPIVTQIDTIIATVQIAFSVEG